MAAIRHVTTGAYLAQIREYAAKQYAEELSQQVEKLHGMTEMYEQAVETVKAVNDPEYVTFHARRLVEMAGHIIMGYLLVSDATNEPELFGNSAKVYVNLGEAEVTRHHKFITSLNPADVAAYSAQ